MSRIWNEKIIKRFEDLVLYRFGSNVELEKHLNDYTLYGIYCDNEELKVKDIEKKSYYDKADESDYEILVTIGNDNVDIYDLTIYYAISRVGENVIVEVGYEEV